MRLGLFLSGGGEASLVLLPGGNWGGLACGLDELGVRARERGALKAVVVFVLPAEVSLTLSRWPECSIRINRLWDRFWVGDE